MDDQDLREEGLYLQARLEERVWQESRQRGISRRRLLQVLAAGTAATALAGVAGGRGRTRAAPLRLSWS